MAIDKRLNKASYKSCVVKTVHDSIVIDVHPNELKEVMAIINQVNDDMTSIINLHFDIKLNVPLLLEAKIGNNWLDMKEVLWYNIETYKRKGVRYDRISNNKYR